MKPNLLQSNEIIVNARRKHKFKLNDIVRISKYKHLFSKSYTPNWSTELFTISKILNTNPITYQLKDEFNNMIKGCFYEQELKKTDFPNTFLIEKILKKNKQKIYVKWLGMDKKHNSWVNVKDVST